jgi:polar amino acid transport system substrate-binding protein
LWLENNIKQAELKPVEGGDAAFDQFVNDKMEALASLRPRLVTDAEKLPGSRILDGQFAAVQQAVGINKGKEAAYTWLKAFVEEAKASGLVASFIEQFGVQGKLSVAPPA